MSAIVLHPGMSDRLALDSWERNESFYAVRRDKKRYPGGKCEVVDTTNGKLHICARYRNFNLDVPSSIMREWYVVTITNYSSHAMHVRMLSAKHVSTSLTHTIAALCTDEINLAVEAVLPPFTSGAGIHALHMDGLDPQEICFAIPANRGILREYTDSSVFFAAMPDRWYEAVSSVVEADPVE